MREKPILFSGPMVREILADRKTQTRRIVKDSPLGTEVRRASADSITFDWLTPRSPPTVGIGQWHGERHCPYGGEGDRLWVRETWRPWIQGWSSHVQYRADEKRGDSLGSAASTAAMEWCEKRGGHWDDGRGADPDKDPWFPSIHMPRWASRLTLDVTAIRVERLQDISEEDARAEGMPSGESSITGPWWRGPPLARGIAGRAYNSAREAFAPWWDHINAARATWESNPWVWCVTFARVEA